MSVHNQWPSNLRIKIPAKYLRNDGSVWEVVEVDAEDNAIFLREATEVERHWSGTGKDFEASGFTLVRD
jgi:hypothetical protein